MSLACRRARRRGVERAVPLSGRVLRLPLHPGGCALRAHRRGAVRGRAGEVAGRAVAGGRAPARARSAVRRGQPRLAGAAPAAPAAGLHAAAAGRRRADRARGRCEQLAAARCPDQRRPAVLPRLRTRGPQRGSVHPRLALLLRRRPGDGPHLLDRRAGRGPPGAGRRRHRGHRRPTPRRGRPAGAGRAVAAGRPGHPRSSWTPATTSPASPTSWPTCPSMLVGRLRSDRVMLRDAGPRRSDPTRRAAAQARRRPHLRQARLLAHPRPGHHVATPPATAWPRPPPGTGCTPA